MNTLPVLGVMRGRIIGAAEPDPRFPLGTPVTRGPRAPAPPAGPRPIPGRPNWVRDADGTERYVEPVRPPQGPV